MKLWECKTCRKCCSFRVESKFDAFVVSWWKEEDVKSSGLPKKTFVRVPKSWSAEIGQGVWYRLNFDRKCPFLGIKGCEYKSRECELFPFYIVDDGLWIYDGCPAMERLTQDVLSNETRWKNWWYEQVVMWDKFQLAKNKWIIKHEGYSRLL